MNLAPAKSSRSEIHTTTTKGNTMNILAHANGTQDTLLNAVKFALGKKPTAVTLIAGFTFAAAGAAAITAPAAGSFGYDLYDILVTQGLQGAPGFAAGVLGVAWSASKLSANWMLASLGVLGSTCVLKADTITTSMGMMTNLL